MELITGALLVTLCLLGLWLSTRRPSRLPPGPPRLPLIGNLLDMNSDFRLMTEQLRRRYGDIFSVYVFQRPTIFLNGYDVIKEALVKNADYFVRPDSFSNLHLQQKKGIASSSGESWKEQRKFALTTLRDLGMGRSVLEDKIMEETAEFLQAFEDQQGEPFNCSPIVHNAVSNIICSIVFGKRFEYTDPIFKEFLQGQEFIIGNVQQTDTLYHIPFLKDLPGDFFKFKKMKHLHRLIEDKLIKPSIAEHSQQDDKPRDFISGYIKEMKLRQEVRPDTSMGIDHLVKSIIDLFFAGSETTTTTLRWALVYFLNYPDVQEKCFQEIKEKIGLNRSPSMKDKTSLPYLEATIMEVLRLGEIAPTTVPYTVSEDLQFRGHVLPKGMTIIPMLHSVLKDQEIWGDPEQFRPERFLDEQGKVCKSEKFIPFSLGRRVCLGESLARMELFLFLTAMTQKFKFVVDKTKPSMNGVIAATHSPKPFTFRAILR